MRIRFWGTRGSLPTPGAATARYGGNTSCVEVGGARADHVIVLDGGSGVRELGVNLPPTVARVDLLLTHLHMDHIIGLGFFDAFFRPGLEVHLWGPSSTTLSLHERLTRYMSPPLFPVRLRDLPCRLSLHDVPLGAFELPGVEVTTALVCHPGPTVGYRLDDGRGTIAYLPDHEPALGAPDFPGLREWTSGYDLAAGVDVLIHDAQYEADEYEAHVGWGHSALPTRSRSPSSPVSVTWFRSTTTHGTATTSSMRCTARSPVESPASRSRPPARVRSSTSTASSALDEASDGGFEHADEHVGEVVHERGFVELGGTGCDSIARARSAIATVMSMIISTTRSRRTAGATSGGRSSRMPRISTQVRPGAGRQPHATC